MLLLYLEVYAEIGEALPPNGEILTVPLNTPNQRIAATVAYFTLFSKRLKPVADASGPMDCALSLWPAPEELLPTAEDSALWTTPFWVDLAKPRKDR